MFYHQRNYYSLYNHYLQCKEILKMHLKLVGFCRSQHPVMLLKSARLLLTLLENAVLLTKQQYKNRWMMLLTRMPFLLHSLHQSQQNWKVRKRCASGDPSLKSTFSEITGTTPKPSDLTSSATAKAAARGRSILRKMIMEKMHLQN